MLPAPDAARVFAFLGIAFSSCICYDWRAVGFSFAAPYNRPRCCNTGGGFLFLCVSRDLLSGIDAFDKFFSAFDGFFTNAIFLCNNFSCSPLPQGLILGTCGKLSVFRFFGAPISSHGLFLSLIQATNQVCLLCVSQVPVISGPSMCPKWAH